MTLALLRRDPTVRALPKFMVIGVVTAQFIAGIHAWRLAHHLSASGGAAFEWGFAELLLLSLGMWIPLAIFVGFGRIGQHCSRLDLVMPIAASRLWVGHLVGVLASGGLILAAAATQFALLEWVLVESTERRLLEPSGVGGALISAMAVWILLAVVLQVRRSSVYAGGVDRWMLFGALVGALGLSLLLSTLPPALALLPLVVAGALGVRSYRRLPPSFALVPRRAEATDETSTPDDVADWVARAERGRTLPRALRLDLRILRILSVGCAPGQMIQIPATPIVLPFLLLFGVALATPIRDSEILRFTNITMAAYMILAVLAAPMAQLFVLDSLPISRRRLFALLVLPFLAVLYLGYGCGRLIVASQDPQPLVVYGEDRSRHLSPPDRTETAQVRVPAEYFEIAWGGRSPAIESPWGETHAAFEVPLYRGSRAVLYSPYSVTGDSSPEFAALQLKRATEAVYGTGIRPEQIRDLPRPSEGPVFPVMMLLANLIWFPGAVIYFRSYRASRSDGAKKGFFFAVLGAVMALHLVQFISFIGGVTLDWVAIGLFKRLVLWLVDVTPGGSLGVWLLCVVISAGGYWWTQAAFERIEVSGPRRKQAA